MITRIIYISIFLFFLIPCHAFAQKEYVEKTNQINDKGKKEGFWVDTINSRLREAYYKDGLESGIFKQYNLNGRLLILGKYCNGNMCGTWCFFDTTGHLLFIFKDFSKNTNAIYNKDIEKRYTPDYKCYSISYYPNGNIKDEGHLLWSEGETPESDLSVEYGEWKYYDEGGKLIKTKEFK